MANFLCIGHGGKLDVRGAQATEFDLSVNQSATAIKGLDNGDGIFQNKVFWSLESLQVVGVRDRDSSMQAHLEEFRP